MHPVLMLPLEPRALLHGAGAPDPLEAFPASIGPASPPATPASLNMPLSSAPQLSSHPQAAVKLYLDFVGAAPTTWGSYNVPTTPAYDTDGDESTFSPDELTNINEIWSRVAEKYSPFNVDVTTVDPRDYAYHQVVRVVVGGTGSWAGGTFGGYSYVNGFNGETSNTAWVFAKNLGHGLPKYVGEAAAHEAGHNFGLYHQSSYDSNGNKTDEYNHGTSTIAPIMGFSYYAERGQWWKGPNSDSGATQDDLAILAGVQNGFGYRPDDHGNASVSADSLLFDGISVSGNGVIETSSDIDYFKFSTTGGTVNVRASVATYGPMLDLILSLSDEQGNVLALANTFDWGETIITDVPAGEYFLAVSSKGGYGDIGQYSISGTVPEPLATPVLLALGAGWFVQRPRRQHDSFGSHKSRYNDQNRGGRNG